MAKRTYESKVSMRAGNALRLLHPLIWVEPRLHGPGLAPLPIKHMARFLPGGCVGVHLCVEAVLELVFLYLKIVSSLKVDPKAFG